MKALNIHKAKLQRTVWFKIIWFTCFWQYDHNSLSLNWGKNRKVGWECMRHQSLKYFVWPSLRTHLSKQMTLTDFRNICTTGNSCRGALPCVNMALKLPWYFYLLMKPLGHYIQVWSLYHTVQWENTYSSTLKVTGQVWEAKKRISINTNHSYYQRSSP